MKLHEPILGTPGTPDAEVAIDLELVRGLIADQHPDLSALDLRLVANGWDNSTWRLGNDLALRLPRRRSAGVLIRHEQRWLPAIARRVSLPIPEPVRVGKPGRGYPWCWSVVRWTDGVSAEREPLEPSQAERLGRFLAEVHVPAPPEAPANAYRGVPLVDRHEGFVERLSRLGELSSRRDLDVDLEAVREVWQQALRAPIDVSDLWLHADLHPRNVVVSGGRLAAVIDWGDLTAGDPATDLAAAWMLFPTAAHDSLWQAYGGVTRETMIRARGWAALFGVILLATGLVDDPAFAVIGRTTLARVCESV